MERTIFVFYMDAVSINDEKYKILESFKDDFIQCMNILVALPKNKIKYDVKTEKKILYLDSYKYDDETGIVDITIISAKYDARRVVLNTDTIEEKGILKKVKDGDKEKNHLVIKFVSNKIALCLFEYNYYGIGFGKIVKYLERQIKFIHKSNKDDIFYNITYRNSISKNFLKSLKKMKRIKMVTLEVDREKVNISEEKRLADRADLSSTVDIVLKPSAAGNSIIGDTVKDFYRMYESTDTVINRITVSGEEDDDLPITFNTEQMKEKFKVDVTADAKTNEVNTSNIFNKLNKAIEKMK